MELSEEQVEGLKACRIDRSPPKHLFRIASRQSPKGVKSTNGIDTLGVHIPAAHENTGENCKPTLAEEPGLHRKVLYRLIWQNCLNDPLLSWTPSLLFQLSLGTLRRYRGESAITIYVVNVDKLRKGQVKHGEFQYKRLPDGGIEFEEDQLLKEDSAELYHAEDLKRVLRLCEYDGWKPFHLRSLRSNQFTHEWLSHGMVFAEEDSFQVDLDEIVDDDFYQLLPHLKTEKEEDDDDLYDWCVRARSIAFCKNAAPRPFSLEQLRKHSEYASRFMSQQQKADREHHDGPVPPLHIFLAFLALEKRPSQDPLFMNWIRSHYTSDDVAACEFHRSDSVANNLPEILQTLALARDAHVACSLAQLSPPTVSITDSAFDSDGQWLSDEPKEIKVRQKKKPEVSQLHSGEERIRLLNSFLG